MEETQEEGQIDIFPVADEKENENDEEKQKKNIPPVMDLELIDWVPDSSPNLFFCFQTDFQVIDFYKALSVKSS